MTKRYNRATIWQSSETQFWWVLWVGGVKCIPTRFSDPAAFGTLRSARRSLMRFHAKLQGESQLKIRVCLLKKP
jgi:hypothetical protein